MTDTNIARAFLLAVIAAVFSIVLWGCSTASAGRDANSGVQAKVEFRGGREVNTARLFDLSKDVENSVITTVNKGSRGVTYSLLFMLGCVLLKNEIRAVAGYFTHRCVIAPIKTIIQSGKQKPP